MIRSSKHILKYQTYQKTLMIDMIFKSYQYLIQHYIDLIWSHKLSLNILLSSKLLPNSREIKHSRWKQLAYKQASEIVRSVINRNKRKKKLTKPILKNISINLDERFFDIDTSSKEFDEFINIKLPYFKENKKRAQELKLPIKYHKHSLKFKNWERKKTVKLIRKNKQYYVILTYEIKPPEIKQNGDNLGIDVGYNKLITTSKGDILGKEMKELYKKISNKKQGSKSFKKSLTERDNKTNYYCNQLKLDDVKNLVVEDLKSVKKSSDLKSWIMNKVQRWSYLKTLDKLERRCEENGVLFTKINPSYTSQECSECGETDKLNRKGEIYSCSHCKIEIDADINAARNILRRGIYSFPINKTNNIFNMICNYSKHGANVIGP